MLELPGLWEDVAKIPLFYLALGKKLRSMLIFNDAVRHFVGQGGSWKYIVEAGVMTRYEACGVILPSQECLQNRIEGTLNELRELCLPSCQAHANGTRRQQGPVVPTTWFETSFGKKSLQDKCEYLADNIFRDYLESKILGQPHWSHIKYARSSTLR